MENRFQASHSSLYWTTLLVIGLPLLGYIDRGFALFDNIIPIICASLLIIVATIWHEKTTYLQLSESYLINSGYRSFGKDNIKISRIKYITRIPQTALPFVGPSLMVIYSTLDDGRIAHCYVREFSYDELVLKQFLTRIKELNPNIELDTEYQEVLQDKRELRTKTENTVQSAEKKLKDKGEVW